MIKQGVNICIHVWLKCFAPDRWKEQKVIIEKKGKKKQRDTSIKNDANIYKYIQNEKKSQLIRLINHLWYRICFCLFGPMNPYVGIYIPYSDIKYEYLKKTLFFIYVSFYFFFFLLSVYISNWCSDGAFVVIDIVIVK
jgi:hypothetical protein